MFHVDFVLYVIAAKIYMAKPWFLCSSVQWAYNVIEETRRAWVKRARRRGSSWRIIRFPSILLLREYSCFLLDLISEHLALGSMEIRSKRDVKKFGYKVGLPRFLVRYKSCEFSPIHFVAKKFPEKKERGRRKRRESVWLGCCQFSFL